jgi:poly(A) polymerase
MVDFLEPIVDRIAMPRRIADGLRRIVAVQPRLAAGKVGRLARNEMLAPALEVLELDWMARGKDLEPLEKMRAELPAPLPAAARSSVPRGGAGGTWRRRGGAARPR